jgi:hypothetical protein
MYDSEEYDDNRKIQPTHGTRTVIPGSDEQFDDMDGDDPADVMEGLYRRQKRESEEKDDG